MDASVFIFLKNTDPVLQKAPGANLYFIFATHQPPGIMYKCLFITSEEATLRSNIHFVKQIHSNPSDNNDLPTFCTRTVSISQFYKVKFTVRKKNIFLILCDKNCYLKELTDSMKI